MAKGSDKKLRMKKHKLLNSVRIQLKSVNEVVITLVLMKDSVVIAK